MFENEGRQTRNGSIGTEQGLPRLLCTQPHRQYQSVVHNSLLKTHQFVLVSKLPLLCRQKDLCAMEQHLTDSEM